MGVDEVRKRIAGSERFNEGIAQQAARYIRYCVRTSDWEREGFDELRAHLKTGEPAVMALWHQRLIMAPYLFDMDAGRICSLTSSARAGRLAGRMFTKFGFDTIAMSSHQRHVALSRRVLSQMKDGVSVGIATDGANGPARISKTFPLVWARSSGKPIFLVTFSTRRAVFLPTWDRMMLPVPNTRGVLLIRRFDHEVPRKLSDEGMEALRQTLDNELNALTAEADRRAGRKVSA